RQALDLALEAEQCQLRFRSPYFRLRPHVGAQRHRYADDQPEIVGRLQTPDADLPVQVGSGSGSRELEASLSNALLAGELGKLGCLGEPGGELVERGDLRQRQRVDGHDIEARCALAPEGRQMLSG